MQDASPFDRWTLALIVALLLTLAFLMAGCSDGQTVGVRAPSEHVEAGAPISNDVKELKEELQTVRARERLLVGAIDDAQTASVQGKLWLGAGACFLAGLVLVGLGVWTSRRVLIELGVAVAGLGALLVFTAWLVPYALFIGIGVAVLVISIATWMVVRGHAAMSQLTAGVDALKPLVPEYAGILRRHIDTGAEKLISHVRATRKV
jgi:hypothetical protein